MAKIKQGFAWWSFAQDNITPEELIKTAAEIGYQGVDMPDQSLWQLIRDHGMAISAIGGHGTLTSGLNQIANHNRIEQEIAVNLELASQWQIPNLICFSGNRDSLTDEDGAKNTITGLKRLASLAEDAGVNLIIELLNSKRDHAGYQCDHTNWAVEVIKQVNSPRVKILYDIYHMQLMEGDLIQTIQEHHQHFAHYHTAGVPGRHEIDDSQEINYPAVVKAIAETDFDGYLVHELIPTGDIKAALKSSYEICDI